MADNPRRVLPPSDTGPPEMEPQRHNRSGVFGVVDIGTTKIACLIGRVESDGSLRVLGFGWQKGRGLNSGGNPGVRRSGGGYGGYPVAVGDA